jgi:hypothetical protein
MGIDIGGKDIYNVSKSFMIEIHNPRAHPHKMKYSIHCTTVPQRAT